MTSEVTKAFTTAAAIFVVMATGASLGKGVAEPSPENQQDSRSFARQQTMKPAVVRMKPGAGYWEEE